MENGLVSPVEEGTPQGGPLSPLLSNLALDELDRELEQRQHRFVRYADDCNIYVASERAGKRVMQSVTSFIRRRLKLKVKEAKSAVARPQERKFLGFSFTGGREPKRRIAPKALFRCKQRIRELTRRTRGISLEQMTKELTSYLRWLVKGYFGLQPLGPSSDARIVGDLAIGSIAHSHRPRENADSPTACAVPTFPDYWAPASRAPTHCRPVCPADARNWETSVEPLDTKSETCRKLSHAQIRETSVHLLQPA